MGGDCPFPPPAGGGRLKRARWALAAAVLAASSLTHAAAPAKGQRDARTIRLAGAGSPALVLRGGSPRSHIVVSVPHTWVSASVRLDLRWRASALVTRHSILRVEINGIPRGVAAVGPGPGRLFVVSPPERIVDHRVVLDLGAVLRTGEDPCPPPDAPGAFLAVDPASALLVTGVRDARPPLLADLPDLLVDRIGDVVAPLTLVLPRDVSPAVVQAAGLVAGAVSLATGFPGTPIRVLGGAGERELRAPSHVVRIEERAGPPHLAVVSASDGRLRVAVAGQGPGLVQAAWALADPSRTALLAGGAAAVAQPVRRPRAPSPPSRLAIPVGAVIGSGRQMLKLPFRVPAGLLLDEPAHLRLDLAFDAPASGRVTVAINGREVGARALPRGGSGRLSVERDLRDGDLRPGDNAVELRVDLAAAAAGRCAPLDTAPRLSSLASSELTFGSGPRRRVASLGLWPFPSDTDPTWAGTTVVVPADPQPEELEAVIEALAEAARWSGHPVLPDVVVGEPRRGVVAGRDLLVLVRGTAIPRALGVRLDVPPAPGLLVATEAAGGVALIGFGPRALSPFGRGFFVGRVRGKAVVVDERGRVRALVPAARETVWRSRPLPWAWPVLGLAVVAAAGLVALMLRASRRLRSLPPPAPGDAPSPEVPEPPGPAGPGELSPEQRAALESWRRLSAEEEE